MKLKVTALFWLMLNLLPVWGAAPEETPLLGESREAVAEVHEDSLAISTLFTAMIVNSHLATDADLQWAIDWCRHNGLRKVYLETYRNSVWADQAVITKARNAFEAAGFEVAGCVTTTILAKRGLEMRDGRLEANPHNACYTFDGTQTLLKSIFEYTASLFDEIIIDDFYATSCVCSECTVAKGNLSWDEYRSNLMLKTSLETVLAPAKAVNPNCKITIKYPNSYDHYLGFGYDIRRESLVFDAIYTGTETREPANIGTNPQYAASFLMQYLNEMRGGGNGGGWFDYIDTTPRTFVEQARQTILGGAPEIMMYHYKAIAIDESTRGVMTAFNGELDELFELASVIKGKRTRGVTVPRPMGSGNLGLPEEQLKADRYVFGFLGMLGIPVHAVPEYAGGGASVIGTRHLLYDADMLEAFKKSIKSNPAAAVTSNLAEALEGDIGDAVVIPFTDKIELMSLPRETLKAIRSRLLKPLGVYFDAPAQVSLHLYDDDMVVVENFTNEEVTVQVGLKGYEKLIEVMELPVGSDTQLEGLEGTNKTELVIPARGLVVLRGESSSM